MYVRSQYNSATDGHSVHGARWKLVRSKNSCNEFSVYIESSLTQLFYLLIYSYFVALIADADPGFLCCIEQYTDMSLPADNTYPEACNKSVRHLTGIFAWNRTWNKVEWYSTVLYERFRKKEKKSQEQCFLVLSFFI